MDLLPMNFYVLRFCGVWNEHKNNNLIIFVMGRRVPLFEGEGFLGFSKKQRRSTSHCEYLIISTILSQSIYTIAAIIYHFTIFEMAELIRMRNDVEDLTESLFLVLTFMCLCLNMNEAKRIACAFMFISQISGFLVLIGPLMTQNERQLPMKMYVPYSMVELLPYLLTYLEQVAVVFYGVSLNVALDSLVYGFIIHTCGQIELMCYRLSETFRFLQENNKEKEHDVIEKFAIAECVKHHVSVCNIMHRIQSLFMWIITILFFFSLITLCSSVYQMSNKMFFSVEFFGFLVYLGAMLFQVFSYCWYGNELDLKNKSIAHAIYTSDWTVISTKQRKSLSFMMMMSQGGRMLSFYGICSLVLSTFTWILKTSYSSFNLLQQATI
ncbi:odorant receptor 46a-like [Mycetomoellerius zeteki]|uniref:odorant receptor 46a-like n=1 Tax=Mycetomoellerius zeteki TaxID=64791 RepID=UPI00084EC881|nr:PREDICTED: odorant receptor 46a-like [Trachymyrmex zeteki]